MMWYFVLAIAIYSCVYTMSYGVWEWKRNNKPASVAVWVFSFIAVVIPTVNILI